jgi:hypothetical protein
MGVERGGGAEFGPRGAHGGAVGLMPGLGPREGRGEQDHQKEFFHGWVLYHFVSTPA